MNTLASMFVQNGKPIKSIYPFIDISFLDFLKDKNRISGIIFSVNRKNYYVGIQNNYQIDDKFIFDFSDGEIEDFEMNQITVSARIPQK